MRRARGTTAAKLMRRSISAGGLRPPAVESPSLSAVLCRPRRLANNQLGFHEDVGRKRLLLVSNPLQQNLRAASAHLCQRLAHRGKRGRGISRRQNVVKAHNRNISRHTQARIVQRAYGADGGNVVEAKHRGKRRASVPAAPASACSRSPAPSDAARPSSTTQPCRCGSPAPDRA